MEGICDHNEYRKNPKTNFTLSKRTEINWMSCEEIGGKYEPITGHLT
jgi:hypothetical protein